MRIDFKGLLEGINNSIFVKEEIEKIAEERTKICKGCPHYSKNIPGANVIRKDGFCEDCGCNIYLKSRSPSSHCPLGTPKSHFPDEVSKWQSLTDDATADQLLETPELQKVMTEYKIKLSENKVNE